VCRRRRQTRTGTPELAAAATLTLIAEAVPRRGRAGRPWSLALGLCALRERCRDSPPVAFVRRGLVVIATVSVCAQAATLTWWAGGWPRARGSPSRPRRSVVAAVWLEARCPHGACLAKSLPATLCRTDRTAVAASGCRPSALDADRPGSPCSQPGWLPAFAALQLGPAWRQLPAERQALLAASSWVRLVSPTSKRRRPAPCRPARPVPLGWAPATDRPLVVARATGLSLGKTTLRAVTDRATYDCAAGSGGSRGALLRHRPTAQGTAGHRWGFLAIDTLCNFHFSWRFMALLPRWSVAAGAGLLLIVGMTMSDGHASCRHCMRITDWLKGCWP
jgi:hypothetical protein